jgi:AraC-like DNA-binding protein
VHIDREAFARLCLVRDVLCDVSDTPPSLGTLAARLGVSQFHLIRQFRALFGTTPHQAQIDARLALAKELLAFGEHSVTEICMEVGFSSLGGFSSLFRRRVGTPPSDYRQRARVLVQVPSALGRVVIPGCMSLLASLPASTQFRRSTPLRAPSRLRS